MNWILKKFDDLNVDELYAVLQLRSAVFVVEQNCVFPDMDGKDQSCHHLMGWLHGELVANTRIVPPGIFYPQPSIGRVVTAPAVRRYGIGRQLMQKSIEALENLYGKTPIKIGAQVYLERFYESFGFLRNGEIYIEDGIDHIPMLRS